MKRYAVTHLTKYSYSQPVELGLHIARLSPRGSERQRLIAHSIDVAPTPAWALAFTDHFGNGMHHIAIETPHQELVVTQRTTIEVLMPPWSALPTGPPWETVREEMQADSFPESPELAEFIYPSPLAPHDDAATAYAKHVFPPRRPVAAAAFELACRIKADFAYAPGATTVATPVAEIMATKRGVCQDFSHVMIAGLRGLGLPARYVSGYLKTRPPQATDSQPPPLVGADASHAWVSVWCGNELGWIDFDPTNALVVGDEHITVAYGRDFADVTPLRGIITGGGQHTLTVGVTVANAP